MTPASRVINWLGRCRVAVWALLCLGGSAWSFTPELYLYLDTSACSTRCMPMEVVREQGASGETWRDRLIWVGKVEQAEARIVLTADSIAWFAKGDTRPRFVLHADPRLHAFDGGLREQWAQSLGQYFLSRLLLYSAVSSEKAPVDVSMVSQGPEGLLFALKNRSLLTQTVEAFLIDRTYRVASKRVEPLSAGDGAELGWPLPRGAEPVFLVIRVRQVAKDSYAVVPVNASQPSRSE